MLPQEAIEAFKKLYIEEYGIEISSEEASLRAHALFKLYKSACMDGREGTSPPSISHTPDDTKPKGISGFVS